MKQRRTLYLAVILIISLFISSLSAYAATASIKINKSYASVTVGKTVTLKATVKGASNKVTWSSSNKKIATVTSNGVVKGIKAGTATITAKANGKTAKCKITVKTKVLDLSTLFHKYFSSVKNHFPGMQKITSSSDPFKGYYRYKGIRLLFDSNGRLIRITLLKHEPGFSMYGLYPGMSINSFISKVNKKSKLKFFYAPTYGWIYKVSSSEYFVAEMGSNDISRMDIKEDFI